MVERVCLEEFCNSNNAVWKWNMVPERKRDWNFPKGGKIHGASNVWSTAQR